MAFEFIRAIKPRLLGLDKDQNLVVNYASAVGATRYTGLARRVTRITSAQLLALNATPISIIPAQGTGIATILHRIAIYKPAGTAYAGIAAGEDLVAKYTNASGAQVSSVIETTGFLDQATAQTRYAFGPASTGSTAGDVAPVANAAVVLHLLTAEIITGTSDLYVECLYDVMRTVYTS